MPPFINLVGKKFGRWTVIKRSEDTWYKHPQFLCQCECGNKKIVKAQQLRDGSSKSCGCYNKEVHRQVCIDRNTTHGMSKTRIYSIWSGMISRCSDKGNSGYNKYGAKGIKVCKRWHKFNNFLTDMGEPPTSKYTIDRINSHGNYEPLNCRWALMVTQQNNRTNNHFLTFNNETHTLQEWSRITGINYKTILGRLEMGWFVENALTVKPIKGRNQYS